MGYGRPLVSPACPPTFTSRGLGTAMGQGAIGGAAKGALSGGPGVLGGAVSGGLASGMGYSATHHGGMGSMPSSNINSWMVQGRWNSHPQSM